MSIIKWDTIKKILAELIIVFVGVFLAFQLNNYKEDVADDKLRKRFYKLMLNDFQLNLKEIKYTRSFINQLLDSFKQKNEERLMPKIKSIPIDISNNMLVLKSAFNSGHLENLDPQYVISLSNGSNYVNRASGLIKRFNNSVQEALQFHDYENVKFYGADNKLKPKYQWYIQELEHIAEYLKNLEGAIENGAIPGTKNLIEK